MSIFKMHRRALASTVCDGKTLDYASILVFKPTHLSLTKASSTFPAKLLRIELICRVRVFSKSVSLTYLLGGPGPES